MSESVSEDVVSGKMWSEDVIRIAKTSDLLLIDLLIN